MQVIFLIIAVFVAGAVLGVLLAIVGAVRLRLRKRREQTETFE